jgi:hypothetical protein
MAVNSCLYIYNGSRWTEKGRAGSTTNRHAEAILMDKVQNASQLILLIQDAAPCPERCESMLINQSKDSTTGKGRKARTIEGHKIIVRIIAAHGGYVDPNGNMQYYFRGNKYNAPPAGFPPIPPLPADPVF